MKCYLNLLYDKEPIDREAKPNNWPYFDNGYAVHDYSRQFLPVNFSPEHAYIDFHLPLFKLLEKYYPELEIRHIGVRELSPDAPFVYAVSFKYLYAYAQNGKLQTFFEDLHPRVRSGIENRQGILLINDMHEHADYSRILRAFRVFSPCKERILIASGNPDNGHYRGTSLGWAGRLLNPLIACWFTNHRKRIPEIFGFRYFEEVVAAQAATSYPEYSYEGRVAAMGDQRLKTFLCLNNVAKPFRTAMCCGLHTRYRERSILSHPALPSGQVNELLNGIWAPLFDEGHLQEFAEHLPLTADRYSPAVNNPWNIVPWDLVNRTFLWVVTETLFEGSGISRCYFTEKTYKPMSLFMPFLLVAQPYSLHNLRSEGFRTFNKYWDESYDLERHSIRRIRKIMETIGFLAARSETELRDMYTDMRPVLEHNYRRLMQSKAAGPFIDRLVASYHV